jgi:hypothetical protein
MGQLRGATIAISSLGLTIVLECDRFLAYEGTVYIYHFLSKTILHLERTPNRVG